MRHPRAVFVLFAAFALSWGFAAGHSRAAEDKTPAEPKPAVHTDLYGDPLPPGAVARMGSVGLQLGERRFQILFSADSKALISLGSDGVIRFWDPETGKELRSLTVKGRVFETVAVSPDGNTLAAGAVDADAPPSTPLPWDRVYLWNAKTHEERTVLHADGMAGRCLAFSPDGKTLATAGRDKIIRLWDVESGKELRKLEGHVNPIDSVVFSPDGSLLASQDKGLLPPPDGAYAHFRMWDVASGKICWQVDSDASRWIADFRFLPGGEGLEIQPNRLRVLNVKDGKELREVKMGSVPPTRFVVSADGKELAGIANVWDKEGFSEERQTIVILSLAGEAAPEFLDGDFAGVYLMALSPDGKTLATVESAPLGDALVTTRIWDWPARRQKVVPPGHKGSVGAPFFLPDGKTLVTGGWDATVRFWEAASGKELRRLGGEKEPLRLLAVSPDGTLLAAVYPKKDVPGSDRFVHILDAATGKELRPLEGQGPKNGQWPWVYTAAFSPDGKALAAASDNGVQLWDVGSGKDVPLPVGLQRPAYRLAFSPDGETLAVLGCRIPTIPSSIHQDGVVHLWNLKSGAERLALNTDKNPVRALAFAPDGRVLACGQRFEVALWDGSTGRAIRHPNPNTTPAREGPIAFSPDGKLFAMPSARGVNDRAQIVAVVETATCQEACRFENGGRIVGGLAFAPDGAHLASGYGDGTVLLWDLRTIPGAGLEPPARLDADALAHLWDDLDSGDAAVGYRAVCALAASPKEALEHLRRRLPKAPPRDLEGIRRLITDLNSDDFEAREAASRKLRDFGPLAQPDLQEAASSPSAEVKRRAQELLAAVDRYALAPGRLREIRAVQALEWIGTPEARRQLEDLAGGESAALLTQDAKAAVERLRGKEARP